MHTLISGYLYIASWWGEKGVWEISSHTVHNVTSGGLKVASFPGLPRVQFLIACSMQKLQAIKNWSRGRPGNEARLKVDMVGGLPPLTLY